MLGIAAMLFVGFGLILAVAVGVRALRLGEFTIIVLVRCSCRTIDSNATIGSGGPASGAVSDSADIGALAGRTFPANRIGRWPASQQGLAERRI